MASLILGCGALISDRIRTRREAKKRRQREYDEQFEQLKTENQKRVQNISGVNGGVNQQTRQNGGSVPNPPSYDAVAGHAGRSPPHEHHTAR